MGCCSDFFTTVDFTAAWSSAGSAIGAEFKEGYRSVNSNRSDNQRPQKQCIAVESSPIMLSLQKICDKI